MASSLFGHARFEILARIVFVLDAALWTRLVKKDLGKSREIFQRRQGGLEEPQNTKVVPIGIP